MWLKRARYDQLIAQLAKAEHQVAVSESALASERRAHTIHLREAIRRVRVAEQRETRTCESLDIERAENRRSERHWANMMLRARQIGAFPLPDAAQSTDKPVHTKQFEPVLDQGELEAVLAAADLAGVPHRDAENFLRKEKGLPLI